MILVSYNDNAINDGAAYRAWFISPVKGLPELEASMAKRYGARPLLGGVGRPAVTFLLLVQAVAGSREWLRAVFNGEDGTPKLLVAADDDGGNQRYLKALCLKFDQTTQPGVFTALMQVHGDVRWRAVAPTSLAWTVTGSGQTVVVNNGGVGVNDEAYPALTATPRQYGTGLNPYRRFLLVPWPAGQPATNYPTDVTNGGLDTRIASTHFYSAAGNDIRLVVDGEEVDFWLSGVNTAATKIWANLDWQAGQAATLAAGLSAGPVTAVTVNEDIGGFPTAGILRIDNELVTYSAKSNTTRTFSGITRAAKGSTAATHAAGATARWVQHDVWVEYGSATLPAITPDNSRKPMFDLATSTNASWNYLEFFEEGAGRAGAWTFTNKRWTRAYGGNQNSAADLYGELGIADATEETKQVLEGHWSLYNPCGIVSANFQSGERWYSRAEWFKATIRSSTDGSTTTTHYTLPTGSPEAWTAWSQNATLVSGAHYVYLWLAGYARMTKPARVEASQVTLALDSSMTPAPMILPELPVYRLAATLTNLTTGDAIEIDFALNLNEGLRIDVVTSEVIYEVDGSSRFAAVTPVGGERHHWLRLAPGANTLRWDEAGVIEVDVGIAFERRFFG